MTVNIHKNHEQIKVKNKNFTDHDNTVHFKEYMDKIECLIQEIDNCNQDIKKVLFAWYKEMDMLEKNVKRFEVRSKEQTAVISKLEEEICSLTFVFNHCTVMKEHKQRREMYQNQKKDAQNHWTTYTTEQGPKLDRVHAMMTNSKNELLEILARNQKYLPLREGENILSDKKEQQCEIKEDVSHQDNVERTNRELDQAVKKYFRNSPSIASTNGRENHAARCLG